MNLLHGEALSNNSHLIVTLLAECLYIRGRCPVLTALSTDILRHEFRERSGACESGRRGISVARRLRDSCVRVP